MTTDIESGGVVEVDAPGGGLAVVDVGPPVMGPPGLRGQRGERGDPGGTTVVVYSFGEGGRTPAELPESGLIPAGWDGPRAPASAIQLAVGQSAEYRPDGYLWLYLGPNAIEGGWIETGQLRGPPGDQGPLGDTGPPGPAGERGLTGQAGSPGPKGDRGDVGPQGARGEIGATGPAGATGVPGPRGEPGLDGRDGIDGAPGRDGIDGEVGPEGPPGERGEVGEPGGPTFIVGVFTTRTASDLATAAPTGLIPAGFDGAQRPPADVQLAPGEAWLDDNPNDGGFRGQAITFTGTLSTPPFAHWIAIAVKGDRGEQGDRGDVGPVGGQGPQGDPGADGARGSLWHWSPFAPPTSDTIGPHAAGDFVLCLIPGGTGTTPGHGDVYHATAVGVFARDGNIRGPAGPEGPQGPPGEVTQAQHDSLALRVTRLEGITAQTLSSDQVLAEDEDRIVLSVPLAIGDHVAQGTFTFELDKGGDVTPSNRLVTMWVEPNGPVVLTGHRSAQLYLHQALPLGSLTFGPMRALVSGPGNAVVYYRVSQPPGETGPKSGRVIAKATTTIGAHPGASGFVAR